MHRNCRSALGWITFLIVWFLNSVTSKAVFHFDCQASLQAAGARAPSAPELFHLALQCWENDIRHLATPDSKRGNGVIAGDWEGWELNICSYSVTLPGDILPAWLWKGAGHPFTEAPADDRCSCNIWKGTKRWRNCGCKHFTLIIVTTSFHC